MTDTVQGSEAWHQQRLGKVTASRMSDVLAKTKTGYGASRATYMGQLRSERLTGQPTQGFTNAAMEWGTATEPQARAAYELEAGITVEEVGFIDHPTIGMFGASPDGLIRPKGGLEIKCPNSETHTATLLGKASPARYHSQMQAQMSCTGLDYVDFVSFDPRCRGLTYFCRRVMRDDVFIKEMESEVMKFLAELDAQLGR